MNFRSGMYVSNVLERAFKKWRTSLLHTFLCYQYEKRRSPIPTNACIYEMAFFAFSIANFTCSSPVPPALLRRFTALYGSRTS
jgi:hypothetical protein